MSTNTTPSAKTSFGTRLGGFAAGALLLLLAGGLGATLFSGTGFGDPEITPPQVYTNF